MIQKNDDYAHQPAADIDVSAYQSVLSEVRVTHPISFRGMAAAGSRAGLVPWKFALLLETLELQTRSETRVTPTAVWNEAAEKYRGVMRRAVNVGGTGQNPTSFLKGNWGATLAGRRSILGFGWNAFVHAIAVQELNAGGGLVSAAPTGGASGTVPGAIVAVSHALDLKDGRPVEAMIVAGLVGLAAFGRGPVSGAQSGCGGEVGVAAAMAAGGVVHLLGGDWEEIDAAGALAGTLFVGLECSPTFGLVEYPCVPRNGFAALCAIAAAEAACGGIVPPYSLDETLDRIFGVGGLLPASLRETNDGHWAAPACRPGGCDQCDTK